MKKIKQLLVMPDAKDSQGCLVALCNDGTIWYMQGGEWVREMNEIPDYGTEKNLIPALRQYRHNNVNSFVTGYDKDIVDGFCPSFLLYLINGMGTTLLTEFITTQ